MITFPQDFLWGAATSAHQVEGDNRQSDWWEWEQRSEGVEPSGFACRHYELYKQDFALAQRLNHTAHRFSVEWSRVEPEEGKFSEDVLAHYQQVITELKQRGIEPIVTLHHFTNPLWFSRQGGWENPLSVSYFERFSRKVVAYIGKDIRFWITINEPLVYGYYAYIKGAWPPQKHSWPASYKVVTHLLRGHLGAYRLIHRFYREQGLMKPMVSIAKNVQPFMPCVDTARNRLASRLRQWSFNQRIIDALYRKRALDFIGINYYTRGLVETKSWRLGSLLADVCTNNHSSCGKNSLGWDIYPEGLFTVINGMRRYRLPFFILENGICTDDDTRRWDFIKAHVRETGRLLHEGIKVIGYLYWSLLDNFEWAEGFKPRFGLVEVDYSTQQRTIRQSAFEFARVCKDGVLDEEI